MKWTLNNWDTLLEALWQHVVLVGIAIGIAFGISMLLGVWASRSRSAYTAVIGVASLLYTVPSLALFALMIPFLGLGRVPAIVGLVAYSLLILIRNIAIGLREIAPEIIDAADGMGFDPWRRFWRIELPLALPVIVAGLRVAVVTLIGIATIAAYINAGGLGTIILAGINQRFPEKIMAGALLASTFAVLADLALGALEKRLRTGRSAT